ARRSTPRAACQSGSDQGSNAARWSRLGAQRFDVMGGHRPVKALEREFASGLDLGDVLDCDTDFIINQNLSAASFAAQSRGEVHDTADCCVIEAPFRTDPAERSITVGDAHAKAEVVPVFAPGLRKLLYALAHRDRHTHRAHRRIDTG